MLPPYINYRQVSYTDECCSEQFAQGINYEHARQVYHQLFKHTGDTRIGFIVSESGSPLALCINHRGRNETKMFSRGGTMNNVLDMFSFSRLQ